MLLNREVYKDYREYTQRIIQFGEGNFLRAFADKLIDDMNKNHNYDSSIIVIQPRDKDLVYELNDQDGLFTVISKGLDKGEEIEDIRVINSISMGLNTYKEYNKYLEIAENPDLKIILSNTTEAGIVYEEQDKLQDRPAESFPGKLTAFLYHRYKTFSGSVESGMYIIPCELIEDNGDRLREIIIKIARNWDLEREFIKWIEEFNYFCNTLVDSIVPGMPENKDEIEKKLGYEDKFMVESEIYYLWVIEEKGELEKYFPANKLGYNVLFVQDLEPYRERKVSILNGAHTSMVPVSYLYGLRTVKESVEDEIIGKFIHRAIFKEIIPTIDMDRGEIEEFARDVIERFKNPYIRHELIDISLNSMSKFRTRVLPSILKYKEINGVLPKNLVFSFASLMAFYRGEFGEEEIQISDDKYILDIYSQLWRGYYEESLTLLDLVHEILGLEKLWEKDLNQVEGLGNQIVEYLEKIIKNGMEKTIEEILE